MAPFNGPLRVCPDNPRYFTDDTGKAVYLTGSHTWANLKDMGRTDPPVPFDFDAYLACMEQYTHNFMRMWTWELTRYTYDGEPTYTAPHPWARTGPGYALDGREKFDLAQFDEIYFARLRARITAAAERGIYVSVMLFEGHGLHASQEPWCRDGHPFCKHNNINGIDADPDDTGRILDAHTLKHTAVTAVQEAYVRKVIDALNDQDNVLYEIANESGAYSTQWQYHLIDFIHAYEREKPKQHPVGMTFQSTRRPETRGTNAILFDSPADWISPNPEGGYRSDPPPADGAKVILTDTDHLWGLGYEPGWVWKSFTRGLNPILMDPIQPFPGIDAHPQWGAINSPGHALWAPIRKQMGITQLYTRWMDLTHMAPRGDLASSTYCLANPGVEYLVYLPEGGPVTVNLSEAHGMFTAEWGKPETGEMVAALPVSGGKPHTAAPPFKGEAVLYLAARKV